jgi:two-component system CheB/CheR fusion protein
MESLQLYQRSILETVKSGLLSLDGDDIVLSHNEIFTQIWSLRGNKLVGERLQNTELVYRCPELLARVEASHAATNEVMSFQCSANTDGEDRIINVVIRPVMANADNRIGSIIYSEDITDRERLQGTVEQLEATSEELQSANEELETTNEELQSTNEELATTNEELQSLNEELENMNEELEHRTQELHQLNQRYAETLKSMPWPVALVDDSEKIQLWNAAAQRLFGVGETPVVGVGIDHLPLQIEVRNALIRRYRAVLQKEKPSVLRLQSLQTTHTLRDFDVHFTPVFNNAQRVEGILMMFGPGTEAASSAAKGNNKKPAGAKTGPRKSSAKELLTKKNEPRNNRKKAGLSGKNRKA